MWFVVRDCLGLSGFPSAEKNIRARLDRLAENNPEWKRKREGTKAFEYHIDCLPAEAQKVLRKRLTHQVLEDAQLPAVVEQKAVKHVAVRDELEVMVKCLELALREVQSLTDKQKAIADARILLATEVHKLREYEAEAGALIQAALSDGRLLPTLEDWAKDYASRDINGFKTWLEKTTPLAALSSTQTGGKPPKTPSPAPAQIKTGDDVDVDIAICSMMGVDPEDVARYAGDE